MNIFLFIFWLIGTIVSIYVVLKYAKPIKMVKHICNVFKNEQKFLDKLIVLGCLLFVIFIVIPGYIVLSWFGAIATYICFNDFE